MRKICCMACLCMLLLWIVIFPVFAAEAPPSFLFELTANGTNEIVVQNGDIITVMLKLYRTDSNDQYMMYAMQDEIRYDGEFLELVEGSSFLGNGIHTTDIAMVDHYREFYMNFLSMSGGEVWDPDVIIGTVQFRVIAESGVTTISNQDYLISDKTGTNRYECTANDLLVILSTECTVTFETNGGSQIPNVVVQFGEKIVEPETPYREGYDFVGWYKDIHLQEKWDFETDIVEGSIYLYAKWEKSPDASVTESENNGIAIWLILLLVIAVYVYYKVRNRKKEAED